MLPIARFSIFCTDFTNATTFILFASAVLVINVPVLVQFFYSGFEAGDEVPTSGFNRTSTPSTRDSN